MDVIHLRKLIYPVEAEWDLILSKYRFVDFLGGP